MKQMDISRVTRSKKEASASYDRLSRLYDLLAAPSEHRHRRRGIEMLNVEEGETVLEIGFGTGLALVDLGKAVGISGELYGLDISPGMLERAERRLSRITMPGRIHLKLGDGSNLPYPDGFFDAIFMCFTLELFDTPEIPIVLSECLRVLENDGRICVVALAKAINPGKLTTMALSLYEWAHRSWPRIVDCRPIYPKESLKKAGFEISRTERGFMWGLPVCVVVGQK